MSLKVLRHAHAAVENNACEDVNFAADTCRTGCILAGDHAADRDNVADVAIEHERDFIGGARTDTFAMIFSFNASVDSPLHRFSTTDTRISFK
jgi:hypothetical protein